MTNEALCELVWEYINKVVSFSDNKPTTVPQFLRYPRKSDIKMHFMDWVYREKLTEDEIKADHYRYYATIHKMHHHLWSSDIMSTQMESISIDIATTHIDKKEKLAYTDVAIEMLD